MTDKSSVLLELSSNHELTDLVQVVSDELAGKLGFSDDDGHWIGMAIREAVNNAIKHGNRLDPEKKVVVSFQYDQEELTVSVRDQGQGFDVAKVPDPLLPENLLNTSGRGVFYIRSFMDDVEFVKDDGRQGTEVRMIKRLRREDQTEKEGKPMKITEREAEGITILDIQGQITLGDGDEELKKHIDEAVAAGKTKILLNMKKVKFMDSSGVGELVGCYTSVSRAGGKLKLVNLNEKVHDILQITQLISVFETFDDEGSAFKSY